MQRSDKATSSGSPVVKFGVSPRLFVQPNSHYRALIDADGCYFNLFYASNLKYAIMNLYDLLCQIGFDDVEQLQENVIPLTPVEKLAIYAEIDNVFHEKILPELIEAKNNLFAETLKHPNPAQAFKTLASQRKVKMDSDFLAYIYGDQIPTAEAPDGLNDLSTTYTEFTRMLYKNIPHIMHKIAKLSNTPLVEIIERKIATNSSVTICFGTNRGDGFLDELGMLVNQNGLIYVDARALAEDLGVPFNPALVTDCQLKLPLGSTYAISQRGVPERSTYEWDHKKALILMLHTQQASNELGSDCHIVVHHIDDVPEIIAGLHTCFTKFSKLIPKNVTVIFSTYEGCILAETSLKGTGEPDPYYERNIRFLTKMLKAHKDVLAACGNKVKEFDVIDMLDLDDNYEFFLREQRDHAEKMAARIASTPKPC